MGDIYESYEPANFTSRSEVVAEVTEIAEEILDADLAASLEEARDMAWTMEGGLLHSLYRALPPDIASLPRPIAKSQTSPTLRDEIYKAARHRAMIAQLRPGNFTKSLEQLIDETWSTADGNAVYNLYSGPYGHLPASEALTRIEKSDGGGYGDAIEILRDWLDE